jgi:hypothetical protein
VIRRAFITLLGGAAAERTGQHQTLVSPLSIPMSTTLAPH